MRTCFVTRRDRAEALTAASQSDNGEGAPTSPLDVKYPLRGQSYVQLPIVLPLFIMQTLVQTATVTVVDILYLYVIVLYRRCSSTHTW